jgi:hypothetical protein
LFIIATVGLVFSLLVHLSIVTWLLVRYLAPLAQPLNIGIFIVFLPALFAVTQSDSYEQLKKRGAHRLKDLFAIMISPSPLWLKITPLCFLAYTIFNVIATFLGDSAFETVKIADQYLLIKNGEVIKEVTRKTFWELRAQQLRVFSGHWMFFYSVSMLLLYTQSKKPTKRRPR